MFRVLLIAFLTAQLSMAKADEIPRFDVASMCRATAAGTVTDVITCIQNEQASADQLRKQWLEFARPDKVECLWVTTELKGVQSYIELLTCLEIAKDANHR